MSPAQTGNLHTVQCEGALSIGKPLLARASTDTMTA